MWKTNGIRIWATLLALLLTSVANAGQKVKVGKRVPSNQLVSMDEFEHRDWNQLLYKYVNDKGQVDYRGLAAKKSDLALLDRYLNTLSRASITKKATKDSKLAFWINAYNAVTIKGILREYPTSSIRNHTARLYGYNIWKDLLLNVGGKDVSLESIEHDILRNMGDPRIHFAIVCASHSCPRLLNEAYVANKVDQQLNTNAKAFFANPENFRFDTRKKRFYFSSIIKWFADDFGSNQARQLRSVAPYLPKNSQQAAKKNSVRVSYLKYDWSLNDWKR